MSGASSVFTTLNPLASRALHLDPDVTHLPRVYLGVQFRPMQGDELTRRTVPRAARNFFGNERSGDRRSIAWRTNISASQLSIDPSPPSFEFGCTSPLLLVQSSRDPSRICTQADLQEFKLHHATPPSAGSTIVNTVSPTLHHRIGTDVQFSG